MFRDRQQYYSDIDFPRLISRFNKNLIKIPQQMFWDINKLIVTFRKWKALEEGKQPWQRGTRLQDPRDLISRLTTTLQWSRQCDVSKGCRRTGKRDMGSRNEPQIHAKSCQGESKGQARSHQEMVLDTPREKNVSVCLHPLHRASQESKAWSITDTHKKASSKFKASFLKNVVDTQKPRQRSGTHCFLWGCGFPGRFVPCRGWGPSLSCDGGGVGGCRNPHRAPD